MRSLTLGLKIDPWRMIAPKHAGRRQCYPSLMPHLTAHSCFVDEDRFGAAGAGACQIFEPINLCTQKSTATSALFAAGVIGFCADIFSEKMPVQAVLQWVACGFAVLACTTMAKAFHSDKATYVPVRLRACVTCVRAWRCRLTTCRGRERVEGGCNQSRAGPFVLLGSRWPTTSLQPRSLSHSSRLSPCRLIL